MEHHLVLRVIAKFLIPVILLFALYVQFHGDYGPGGGFQAGVIFATGFILYALVFGLAQARRVLSPVWVRKLAALGVLLYAAVGVVSMLKGGLWLDYNALLADPISAQHLGIFVVELGVGMTVAATMILLFYIFAQP